MNDLELKILDAIQNDFPLNPRPYDIIAEKFGVSCEDVLSVVQKLVDEGVIRRIGVSFDSRKLGFSSTLAAVKVCDADVERAAEIIGAYREVTHNYLRSAEFNIWFTIIAASQARIEEILEEIRAALSLGSSDLLNLPAKRIFKLDTRFNVSKGID